ncbi:hypothetical protein GCM10020218_062660 [Dactylosporangium vinaceum]
MLRLVGTQPLSLDTSTPNDANRPNRTVFNSDDYWVYERLKRYATRMETIPVVDLPRHKAMAALRKYRKDYCNEHLSDEVIGEIYDKIGGRLSYLSRVAKAQDPIDLCDTICEAEKTWFLNKCWILGEEMDDDVMDQQKYAVSVH